MCYSLQINWTWLTWNDRIPIRIYWRTTTVAVFKSAQMQPICTVQLTMNFLFEDKLFPGAQKHHILTLSTPLFQQKLEWVLSSRRLCAKAEWNRLRNTVCAWRSTSIVPPAESSVSPRSQVRLRWQCHLSRCEWQAKRHHEAPPDCPRAAGLNATKWPQGAPSSGHYFGIKWLWNKHTSYIVCFNVCFASLNTVQKKLTNSL